MTVDVVEPIEKFAQQAKVAKMSDKSVVGDVDTTGLEDWRPEARYDLIWNKWCLGHLTDQQLVVSLRRYEETVTVDEWIVIKENMSMDLNGEDVYDELNSSVTRTNEKFQQLFKEVDARLVKTEVQKGYPNDLYPVRFRALGS